MAYIMSILPVLVTMVIMVIVLKLISVPFKIIVKLLVNSIFGALGLLAVNFFGGVFGIHIDVNLLNSVIVGLAGLPGVIVIIIYQKFFI